MLHRLLPVLLILILLSLTVFNFQAIRRELAYKLHISGDPTTSCCSEKEVVSATGEFDEAASFAVFNGQTIDYPKTSLSYDYFQDSLSDTQPLPVGRQVLGTTNAAGEEKWIEVSITEQRLRAWEGNRVVMEFPVSSGKWAPTPNGDFRIWYKTRRQKMEGGSQALGTYYYLPNVPHNMFFYKGYAIHGAYWHNNFGQPMSHGCVNEPLANAAAIFEWAGPILPEGVNALRATSENPGTRVFVH